VDSSFTGVPLLCFITAMKTSPLPRRARSRALKFALFATATPSLALASSLAHAHAATPATALAACGGAYTVRPGDTLWGIGAACGVSVATLQRLNADRLGTYLQVGQTLQIADPNVPRSYVVQPGDTLDAIARRLGLDPAGLAAANGLGNGNLLRLGQVLVWHAPVDNVLALSVGAPTAAPTAPVAAAPVYRAYQVRPGDTLSGIAQAYQVSPRTLQTTNGIANPRLLETGSVLRIPGSTVSATGNVAAPASATVVSSARTTVGTTASAFYRVAPGDTLSGIAYSLGLTPAALAARNGLSLNQPIRVGQALRYALASSSTSIGATYASPTIDQIGAELDVQSAQVGIEDALLKAIAFRESSWRMVDATDGGIGVMQLMPYTVTWLKQGIVPGNWDAHNYVDNIHAGASLLRYYSTIYAGDLISIATAYHGGAGVVGQTPTPEMQTYLAAVSLYRQTFLRGLFP